MGRTYHQEWTKAIRKIETLEAQLKEWREKYYDLVELYKFEQKWQ